MSLAPIEVRLNGPQSRAFRAIQQKRTICLPWGRGVGKSTFLRFVAFMLVAQWRGKSRIDPTTGREARTISGTPVRGVRVVVLMPTLKQFKDVHGIGIERENAEDWAPLGGKLDKTTWRISFSDGSWIQPFPAELANSRRARGLRADVVITDETDDIDQAVFEAVARPWFSEPFSLKIRLCAGTPTRGRHGLLWHLHQLGLSKEQTADRYVSFHATYRDAPETVDPEEVADAKANSPPDTFAREWECNFDAGEGLVYPFDPEWHVREAPRPEVFREFHVGVDFGWVDPGVMLLAGVKGHGNDAELWVLDEFYESECPDSTWDERAKDWKFGTFWPDPSRPSRAADFRKLGCRVGETDNKILPGISRVADLMFRRQRDDRDDFSRLYIDPRCVNLIRELGLYRRKKRPDGTFSDDPMDRDNHACDALRYLSVGAFGRAGAPKYIVSGR